MLRTVFALMALALQACASAPGEALPNAATFRRVGAIEFYDFRLNVSHAGGPSVRGRDCSNDDYYCYAGMTVLIAPRDCRDVRRFLLDRSDWRVGDRINARYLFRSEDQYYFASGAEGASGFVYDPELGVVGVWRTAPLPPNDLRRNTADVLTNTKWLEAPRTLFACS
jgi:hypothetical protein